MNPALAAIFVLLGLVLLVGGAWAIYVLLNRISAEGGAVDGDAGEMTNQILAELDGFRGSRTSKTQQWDGVSRLAPPTEPGGAVGGWGDGGGG